ncbi:Mitochondrial-processing peptidase subunit alpha, partial [Cladochytrium tenue]
MLATARIHRHFRSHGSRLLLTAPFLRQAPPSPRRSLSTPAAQAAPQKSLGAFPTEITTLPNGVRVASQDAPGHFVTVGAYVDVGSRYETDETAGFCHMLDRLSYKGTKSFTRDQLLSEIEALGGNFFSQTSREATIYQAAVFRKDLPKAVHLLSEVVTEPVISAEEVDAAKETIQYELLDMQWRLDSSLQEKLQRLAFGGLGWLGDQAHLITAKKDDACATSALDRELDAVRGVAGVGRSMICTDASLAATSAEAVRAFRSLWYTPDRIVVAGVGMPHQELVDLARASFGTLPPATSEVLRRHTTLSVPSSYTGGIVLIDTANGPTSPFPDDQNLTHVFIAFEAPSLLDPDV